MRECESMFCHCSAKPSGMTDPTEWQRGTVSLNDNMKKTAIPMRDRGETNPLLGTIPRQR